MLLSTWPTLALHAERAVGHEARRVVLERGRQVAAHARDHTEVLRHHRLELRARPARRASASARAYSRLGGGVVAASQQDVASEVLRVRDVRQRAERLGRCPARRSRQSSADVELALVDVRARDAPKDRRRARLAFAQQVAARVRTAAARSRDAPRARTAAASSTRCAAAPLRGTGNAVRCRSSPRDRARRRWRTRSSSSPASAARCRANAPPPPDCRRDLERERHRLALDLVEQLARARNPDLADRVRRALRRRAPLNHQMLGAYDRRVAAQNRRALDDVLQLAHVPGPPMHAQRGASRPPRTRLGCPCSRVSCARK